VEETHFAMTEVSEFRSIFLERTRGDPMMSLNHFKELMSPVCPMGDKNSHAISGMWREACGDVTKMCDFPDFLILMRRMLDMNFANMNNRLHQVQRSKTVRKTRSIPLK